MNNKENPILDSVEGDIEVEINKYIEKMKNDYGYFIDDLPSFLQTQWYTLLLESRTSDNRSAIKQSLEEFLKILESKVNELKK